MKATRRQAREWAVQMLVAADLNPPSDIRTFMDDFWRQIADIDEQDGGPSVPPPGLKDFAEERVAGVLGSLRELDEILVGLLDRWDLYRLGSVERVVLRLGVWELGSTDVPKPVVINEAIDLANWFSTPRSRTLVNGVLDRFAREGRSRKRA